MNIELAQELKGRTNTDTATKTHTKTRTHDGGRGVVKLWMDGEAGKKRNKEIHADEEDERASGKSDQDAGLKTQKGSKKTNNYIIA